MLGCADEIVLARSKQILDLAIATETEYPHAVARAMKADETTQHAVSRGIIDVTCTQHFMTDVSNMRAWVN